MCVWLCLVQTFFVAKSFVKSSKCSFLASWLGIWCDTLIAHLQPQPQAETENCSAGCTYTDLFFFFSFTVFMNMYLADHYKVGGPTCPPNLSKGLGTPVPVCPAVIGRMKGKFQPIKWVICCTAAHLFEASNFATSCERFSVPKEWNVKPSSGTYFSFCFYIQIFLDTFLEAVL